MTVKVNPGDRPQAIDVATEVIDSTHYPVYKQAFGSSGKATDVSNSNPLPIVQTDSSGNENLIGVFGEQLAADIRNDILVSFVYGLSSYDVATSTANGGSVGTNDHMAYVSAGTAIDGEAVIESKKNVRYRPGHTALGHFTALFENGPVAGATQYIGPFNDSDGIYVGYNGTDRIVGYFNTGTHVQIKEEDWNGDPLVRDMDWTKFNVFRVKYGWLGVVPITYQTLLPGTDRWVNIHTVRVHGETTHPHIGIPSMPMQMKVVKTSGTEDIIVRSGSWQAGVIGFCQTCGDRPFSGEAVAASVGATSVTLAIFKSRETHQSISNKVFSKLVRYQFYVDPPTQSSDYGTIRFRLILNPTLSGTPSYTDVDVDNSVMQIDTSASYDSGGITRLTDFQGYAGGKGSPTPSSPVVSDALGLEIQPGDVYAVVADRVAGDGAPDVRATFNWSELF